MAVLRRLGQGEAFSPAIAMDRIDAELPDSLHRKMTYVRDYARILAETGELTPAKWGVLEEVAEAVPLLAQKLNLRADQAVKAAVQSQVTARATQGQRMAGRAIQQAAPAMQWTLASGLSDGPEIGVGRRNSRGYDKSKEVWAEVDGRRRPILRVPYVEEKWKDEARNRRFEETRNPTRSDVLQIAESFVRDAHSAGLEDAVIALAPQRKPVSMNGAPMWEVARAMGEMTGNRLRLDPRALTRTTEAPTRTSIYDQGASEDLSKIYSGPVPIIGRDGARYVSAFAGDSELRERFNERGVGRNRSYSEDYLTLGGSPIGGSGNILLLDDSVNQGSSQMAAALKLHELNPRHVVSPLAYWGFAGAPVKPGGRYRSANRVRDVVDVDQQMIKAALDRHQAKADEFISEADRYAAVAEQQMRDDPVGNFLGGLFTGSSEYDQTKAERFLRRYLADERQRMLAVKLAAQRVDPTGSAFHRDYVDDLKRDPARAVATSIRFKSLLAGGPR